MILRSLMSMTLEEALKRIAELEAENADLRAQLAAVSERLQTLERGLFGQKSEKMPSVKSTIERNKGKRRRRKKAAKTRKRNEEARKALPEEHTDCDVPPDAEVCPRCGRTALFKDLGRPEETVIYEWIPGRVVRRVYHRKSRICTCGHPGSIIKAPGPERPFERCRFGPHLIARIIVDKCLDALPYYRQQKRFSRLGIPLGRNTMSKLIIRLADELRPIWDRLLTVVRQSDVAQADETILKVQAPVKTRTGYVWVFLAGLFVVYWFTPKRNQQTARELLGDGEGRKLVVDGATFYNGLANDDGGWDRCGCLSHARRKFFDCRKNAPAAIEFLNLVHELYVVEDDAIEQGVFGTEEHLDLRQRRSKPIVENMKKWLDLHDGRAPPKSAFSKAVNYALNQWKTLIRFLDDPLVPLDNNWSENNVRLVAIIRKNCLFAGHDEGAQALAILCSLAKTCELHGVDPSAYFADVIMRVGDHPAHRIDELLPNNWAETFGAEHENDLLPLAA
jgi:transposase